MDKETCRSYPWQTSSLVPVRVLCQSHPTKDSGLTLGGTGFDSIAVNGSVIRVARNLGDHSGDRMKKLLKTQ
jgi:hypothetical protein